MSYEISGTDLLKKSDGYKPSKEYYRKTAMMLVDDLFESSQELNDQIKNAKTVLLEVRFIVRDGSDL